MQKITLWLILFGCLLFISCGKTKEENVKDLITEYYNDGHFNGAVLLVKNDSIICDTILGYSNFSTKTTFEKETPFYIASLSKPITAIGIMLLQQRGSLSYDDSASKYVSDLPTYAHNITIRQLLTHTSGIKDYEMLLAGRKGLTNQYVIKWLQEQKELQFQPGSQFEYSNTGYIILSLVIESVSGQTYSQFLQNNVFSPLNMTHTKVYDETRPFIPNKAIGFNKEKSLDDYSILTTGDGGIYSTTEDLYKLDKALRHYVLLSKDNTVRMYQLPILPSGKENEYGLGWFIENTGSEKIAMHTGGLNGFRSLFWRDLKNNITLIALTNQGDAFPVNNFLNDMRKTIKTTNR